MYADFNSNKDMNERIKKIITEKGMTPSSFSIATNIHPTTISHIMNGRGVAGTGKKTQMPSTDVVTKILSKFPDISAEWLMMGIGPMYKNRRVVIQPDLFPETALEPPPTPVHPEPSRKIEAKVEEKETKLPQKQMLMPEISLSDNIDKIVIFFKNKTYITLKPEE